MKRTPVAHVIFPRRNPLRPVPEFAWLAAASMATARGLDLEVIMPVPIRGSRALQSLTLGARNKSPWPVDLDRILLDLDPRPTLVPYLPVPRRSIESAAAAVTAALIKRPRAGRPSVIQGSFLDEGGYVAAFAARAIGCASIGISHGSDARAADSHDTARCGNKRRALSTIHGATEVIAVSHELAARIARFGRKAQVLPFTSSPERFELQSPAEGPPVVLFVGRLERAKGVDLLLEAFAKIQRSDARLELVGADGDIDVPAEAARLGIVDRVRVVSEVSQSELPAMYGRCTCLALPSRAEGLACVLVESLLVGRPVIATDVGGTRELVGPDVGALVPDRSPEALAEAIDSVLDGCDKQRWDPAKLRERALPSSWDATGPELEALTWRMIACASSL